jgi:lipopolysaccharide biosynthesis glycosyltransferase
MITNCIDNPNPQISRVRSSLGPASETFKDITPAADSMRIVMACDASYAMPLATALRSILEVTKSSPCPQIFVLCSQFTQEMKEKVTNSLPRGSAQLHWLDVRLDTFGNFSTLPYISVMTFARLLLPEFFPASVSRLLYLDTDILALHELSSLWQTDLGGNAIGAVIDSFSSSNAQRIGLASRTHSRSVLQTVEYFNAGVLLIDLEQWRRQQISESAISFLIDHPQTLLADQDALNISCKGKWKRLDHRWNSHDWLYRPKFGYRKMKPDQRPAVVHFVGRYKPWLAKSLSVDHQLYDEFRNRTQFSRSVTERFRDCAVHYWVSLKAFARRNRLVSIVRQWLVCTTVARASLRSSE